MSTNVKYNKSEAIDKKISVFLDKNPAIKEAIKLFNINVKEYSNAINSADHTDPIISFTNTQWLPGKK